MSLNDTPIIQKNYDFLRYLIPILNRFPKSHKFLLADRIQSRVLDNQEKLIEAYYAPSSEKQALLRQINLSLEQLRFLIRLCHDLQLLDHSRYEHISRMINEIGAMLGGWIKSLK
ncbi:MAG: diversity-generating retroelement protein Avd [Microscillaceae bacterium]|nr:diversity-generating retroelement protein Avd [Microscillaceae bacterium]